MILCVQKIVAGSAVDAIIRAYHRRYGKLPVFHAAPKDLPGIYEYLNKNFLNEQMRFDNYVDNYQDIIETLAKGKLILSEGRQGGLFVYALRLMIKYFSSVMMFVAKVLSRRSLRLANKSLPKHVVSVYQIPPACFDPKVYDRITVVPDPFVFKTPGLYLKDKSKAYIFDVYRRLTKEEKVFPMLNVSAYDVGVYAAKIEPRNVFAPDSASNINEWAEGLVKAISGDDDCKTLASANEKRYYINNSHVAAPLPNVPRVLLVGDMMSLRLQYELTTRFNRPVDYFATSLDIHHPRFKIELDVFMRSRNYVYSHVVLGVGNHMSYDSHVDSKAIVDLDIKAPIYLSSPATYYMYQSKYEGYISRDMITQRRNYIRSLSLRLNIPLIEFMDKEVSAGEIMNAAVNAVANAVSMTKDEGEPIKNRYKAMKDAGMVDKNDATLEFEEWETLSIRDNETSDYLFVGGCFLRDCCAATARLPKKPTSELYSSSHSCCAPEYFDGLMRVIDGKKYDMAFFNFGAHIFEHSEEELNASFERIIGELKKHAKKIVLMTLPEMTPTGPDDQEECREKNKRLRWANERFLNYYSKKYTVVPMHSLALKYLDKRKDSFHFAKEVYDSLLVDMKPMIGDLTK